MSEAPATPTAPAEPGEHLVRHRRRRRHRFRPESEAMARRRQDLRALAWILPGCLLALGGVLLLSLLRDPEPASRPKDLLAFAVALLAAGAAWLAADLAWRWIEAVREWNRKNRRDDSRRHHHHHHGGSF